MLFHFEIHKVVVAPKWDGYSNVSPAIARRFISWQGGPLRLYKAALKGYALD